MTRFPVAGRLERLGEKAAPGSAPQPQRKKGARSRDKQNDARIQRLYGQRCCNVEIDILDIGKVFKVARDAIAAEPGITDEVLADTIATFVQTIRRN